MDRLLRLYRPKLDLSKTAGKGPVNHQLFHDVRLKSDARTDGCDEGSANFH